MLDNDHGKDEPGDLGKEERPDKVRRFCAEGLPRLKAVVRVISGLACAEACAAEPRVRFDECLNCWIQVPRRAGRTELRAMESQAAQLVIKRCVLPKDTEFPSVSTPSHSIVAQEVACDVCDDVHADTLRLTVVRIILSFIEIVAAFLTCARR